MAKKKEITPPAPPAKTATKEKAQPKTKTAPAPVAKSIAKAAPAPTLDKRPVENTDTATRSHPVKYERKPVERAPRPERPVVIERQQRPAAKDTTFQIGLGIALDRQWDQVMLNGLRKAYQAAAT